VGADHAQPAGDEDHLSTSYPEESGLNNSPSSGLANAVRSGTS
jgi:hypothetical protein